MVQLFEPKFIRLVNDDEEHLIVCRQFMFIAFRKLGIQNFFRVLAGHIAQEILRLYPLTEKEQGGAPKQKGCLKNQRKFWSLLLFSRIVGWGREFANVSSYVIRNTLEALNLIPYVVRKKSRVNTT